MQCAPTIMRPFDKLIHEMSKLPGIGQKTALRLALHILDQPSTYAHSLAQSLIEVTEKICFCAECFHLTDTNPCSICSDPRREKSAICVVEDTSDLLSLEKSGSFRGLYHVLHGALSPLDGIGPEHLRIRELLERIRSEEVTEVILATNTNVTGEATALYISRLIKPLQIKVTKLASGIPVGGDIEYSDPATLTRAMQLRVEY